LNSSNSFSYAATPAAGANATTGRRNVLALFCVLAFAIAAMVALPAGANAAFGISNFDYKNSDGYNAYGNGTVPNTALQVGAHPNVSVSFNRNGSESEDLKDVQLDLPTGVFADPENGNPKCTSTQFAQDKCPENAQVGSVLTKVKALGLLNLDIHGTIDVISPDPGQVATLGLTLRPEAICILFVFCAQPEKIFLKTGITIRSYEDSGLRTYTPGTPRTAVIGIPLLFNAQITGDITINRLALDFQARYGVPGKTTQSCSGWGWFKRCTNTPVPMGEYFWRQTGSCVTQQPGEQNNVATSNVTLVSYQGATASASKSFTPTGCKTQSSAGNVPFNPTFTVQPANTSAGASSALNFQLNVPEADATIQEALPKIVDLDFPNGSGLDLAALSGVTACTETQLKASACPASSVIGTSNAFSKYLPNESNPALPGLNGKVFAMGVGNQIPVGVEIIGPRNTIIIFRGTLGTRGDANAGTGRVYATFDRIPQLPYASFSMNITKTVFKNPVPTGCTNGQSQVTTSTITGFNGSDSTGGNGTVVHPTGSYAITNCPTTPNTTIGTKPPSTTTNPTPNFTFSSDVAGATFQCAIDSTTNYSPCTTPYVTPTLTDGPHTFRVRAVNAGLVDPTPASYTFTVSTQTFQVAINSITPTTTQARAHPDVAADVDVIGGQPKSISLRLPEGFAASLDAAPLCATTNALAGTCAANSKVGSITLTVNTGSGPQTGVGDIFLTDGPTGADAGGIAVKVPLGVGTFIAQGGAYIIENGKYQFLELRSMPSVINGQDITVTNLKLNFSGANNFLTNPSNCSVTSAWQTSGLSYAGNQAGASSTPFTATGCSTVSFNPQITQTLTNPTASAETGVNAVVGFGADDSGLKILRVNEPPSLGPNFPSFGQQTDQCPASSATTPSAVFDPSGCPAQALVGTMTINTPLLPNPLTGQIYLINKSPLPWLGVKFDQPGISVRLTGVTSTPQVDPFCDPLFDPNGFCQTQISILFNNLPDVPISSIDFSLDGPNRTGNGGVSLSGKILVVATPSDPTCQATSTANSTFYPFSGTPSNVARSQNISITGCN